MVAIIARVSWKLIVIFICISLMTSEPEYCFVCHRSFVFQSLEIACSCSLSISQLDCCWYYWALYTYWVSIFYQYNWQIVPPIPLVGSSLCWWFPLWCRNCLAWCNPIFFFYFGFNCLCFLGLVHCKQVSNQHKSITNCKIMTFYLFHTSSIFLFFFFICFLFPFDLLW